MGNVYSMALFLNLSTHLPPAGVIPPFQCSIIPARIEDALSSALTVVKESL